MSLTTRHMIDQLTYWVYAEANDPTNPYATGSWSAPVTLQCEFESGGRTQTDQNGAEFQPMSTFYTASEIPRGASIMIGRYSSAEPPASAENVRKVGKGTSLRGQASEFVSWTG